MKVVLSRKGFDSKAGGVPSPILPDGRLLSLPIPREGEARSYSDLRFGDNRSYADILCDLRAKVARRDRCHVDPDIYRQVLPRPRGWRPVSGHRGNAQSELARRGIGAGDLLLFFGWFKEVEMSPSGRLAYVRGAPDLHVVFGYLQIDKVIPVSSATTLPHWMTCHPHASKPYRQRNNNTIYVSRSRAGWDDGLPGAGPLAFSEKGVLTKSGLPRSRWDLPRCFRELELMRVKYDPIRGCFQSSPIGQEFVVEEDPRVERWAKAIIRAGSAGKA